jgi:type IV secretion system protein VirB4
VLVTPEIKEMVWSALTSLASAPAAERTMTGLTMLLQSTVLRSALSPYTLDGPFGALLDAARDDLALSDMQCFETEALMGQAGSRRSDLSLPPARSPLHRSADPAHSR